MYVCNTKFKLLTIFIWVIVAKLINNKNSIILQTHSQFLKYVQDTKYTVAYSIQNNFRENSLNMSEKLKVRSLLTFLWKINWAQFSAVSSTYFFLNYRDISKCWNEKYPFFKASYDLCCCLRSVQFETMCYTAI